MIKLQTRCALLLALSTVLFGCASTETSNEHAEYDAACEQMAAHYRTGRTDQACFCEMLAYFRRRMGMSVTELQALLGEPLVVDADHMYFDYALNKFIDTDTVGDPGLRRGKDFDTVLLYSEKGPPDHWIPDASFNLFFIIKDYGC